MKLTIANLVLAFTLALACGAEGQTPSEIIECAQISRMESRSAAKGRGDGPFGDYWWANRFLSRLELAKSYKAKTVDIVMLGDSIMHFWEWKHPESWAKFTANRTVLNCGYGGDRTQNVLWRIAHGELDGYEAKNVVLMIGTNNNSGKNTKSENVAKGIEKIIEEIKLKQPKAKIILHPIFPRGNSSASVRHASAHERNKRTNELIKAYAQKHPEIVWIDFNEKLVDASGWVPRDLMGDEIHPTAKAYEFWIEALRNL